MPTKILVTPGTSGTATVNNDRLETIDGDLSYWMKRVLLGVGDDQCTM